MIQETITMSTKELSRLEIITKLNEGTVTVEVGAKQMNLSMRQVKRLKKAVKKGGAKALIHGNKGRESNRRISKELITKAMSLIREKYLDFKPTFAKEKLEENHDIKLSIETIRIHMIKEKLWTSKPHKNSPQHRSWRPRKEYYGEMDQFDGCYHKWFEDRGPESCLLAAIDDAKGIITHAKFADNESIQSVNTFWEYRCQKLGKPVSIYLDKYSTYKINHPSAVDNSELLTQFGRAMKELDIKLIVAHSPQAKGRIERLFNTLQDRLVKELRLRNISDRETANRYLEEEFIPWFNDRFSVIPAKEGDVNRTLITREIESLPSIFSVKSTRKVMNDFTISFKGDFYQLLKNQPVTVCRKDTILVEERLDSTIHLRHDRKGKYLNFVKLSARPLKISSPKITALTTSVPKESWKPAANHPWKNDPHMKKIIAQQESIKQSL
jgi:hypothetical protein